MADRQLNGRDLDGKSPLILLDSVASLAVEGGKWMRWRNPNHAEMQQRPPANFRFGAGPERPIQGTCVIRITPPPKISDKDKDHALQLRNHVVEENVPLLISRDSSGELLAKLNFIDPTMAIKNMLNPNGPNTVRPFNAPWKPRSQT